MCLLPRHCPLHLHFSFLQFYLSPARFLNYTDDLWTEILVQFASVRRAREASLPCPDPPDFPSLPWPLGLEEILNICFNCKMDPHKAAGPCALRLWIARSLACGLMRQMVREKHLGTALPGISQTKGCAGDGDFYLSSPLSKGCIQQGAKLLSVSVSPSLPMSFSPQSGCWGSEGLLAKAKPGSVF